ncbi:helicase HerA-like domain-containing protein [Brackiella oedipodis]|uniref:helicase HerA-like domain-containing protein n=1 Tax=Brackiella oedipodis TaxID=124225 RepID=UPI0004905F86|nr:helicase HerA-like domain-containing protein [Brackiella oedipodis]
MAEPVVVGQNSEQKVAIIPKLINRHGLITGATGTGKTVSLQVLAQAFSELGIPVFMADVKGDLTGIAIAGQDSAKQQERRAQHNLPTPHWGACPTVLWDLYAEKGHPVRATVSDMGPLLLARIMDLNETQTGILHVLFRVADDEGLLILDFKDLKAMLQNIDERSSELRSEYGNIAKTSIGAIQRRLLELESAGVDHFFGEPMLDIHDLMRQVDGKGVVNILAADKLMQSPKLYSIFLLWLLAEIYEHLPEVGDLEIPKFAFFFDEAHLLFNDIPKVLLERIEQIVRLIRSKGVGVYFISQSPSDIPDSVLGQLGNRIQHALRAFTPKDQKAVKVAADTMRPNPKLDISQAITELGVGEALVSFLEAKGNPAVTERVWMYAPGSQIGPASPTELAQIRRQSPFADKYEQSIDRESAYEVLQQRTAQKTENGQAVAAPTEESGGWMDAFKDLMVGSTGPRGGRRDGLVQQIVKSEVRLAGRHLLRGVLGSLIGRK